MPIQSWRIVQLVSVAALAVFLCGCSEIESGQVGRHVGAYMIEADRQLTLGHPAQARQWMDRATKLAPDALPTYFGLDEQGNGGLIHVLAAHDDWPDTVTYIGAAVARPALANNASLWGLLAQAQDHLGQAAASQASYRKQLTILNSSAPAAGTVLASVDPEQLRVDKATAEWGSGLQAQAVTDFMKVINGHPGSESAIDAENSLAYMEAVDNTRLPQSYALASHVVAEVRAAGVTDTTLGEFLDTLAWSEYRLGKFSDAARDEEEAIGDIPTEAVAHYHLACIYHATKDDRDAQIEIDRSIALSPSDVATQEALRQIRPGAQAPKV